MQYSFAITVTLRIIPIIAMNYKNLIWKETSIEHKSCNLKQIN